MYLSATSVRATDDTYDHLVPLINRSLVEEDTFIILFSH